MRCRPILPLLAMLLAAPAIAGAPYTTDDPQPTDFRHWQLYAFAVDNEVAAGPRGSAGFDISYGAAPRLELNLTLPLAYDRTRRPRRLGAGDISAAAKLLLVRQREGSLLPDLAVAPRLFLPSGGRALGTGRVHAFLPIWLEKDSGRWSLFGGGGWQYNPGRGQRNGWYAGATVTRDLGSRLTVGVEFYRQTPLATGDRSYAAMNLGMSRRLGTHLLLLAAAGPGLVHPAAQGRFNAYLGIEAVY